MTSSLSIASTLALLMARCVFVSERASEREREGAAAAAAVINLESRRWVEGEGVKRSVGEGEGLRM